MSSKYYTPTIEEFHVGFEYEFVKKAGSIVSYTFPECPRAGINYGNMMDRIAIIESWIDPVRKNIPIRVKYLDREDIESLGFERDIMRGKNVYSMKHGKFKNIIYTLREYFDADRGRITIYNNAKTSLEVTVTIKNKSELKRLLKQLKINDNN